MKTIKFSNPKLNKSPIVSLLQYSKTTSQILQIQTQLITNNLITTNPSTSLHLLSSLLLTSPNTHSLKYAELLFSQIHQPTVYICNTMLKDYVRCPNPRKGLDFYVIMRRNGVWGDDYSNPFLLKACRVAVGLLFEGREVHCEVVKRGFEGNVFVTNGLIGMYSKCGEIVLAWSVFDCCEVKDLVSWNLMLGGYVQCREMGLAQKLFDEMPEKDVISWSIMIDGYGKKLGDVPRARVLFDGMPSRDLVSWNSMIKAHINAGDVIAAYQLFDEMKNKNVITWSIMINACASHGNPIEALDLFGKMLSQDLVPDKVLVVGAISACAQLGALDQGRWIHAYINKHEIPRDLVVETALVDMYMKCGSLIEARQVFDSMTERNVVSWNAMILGLGMNGFGKEALECIVQMEVEGVPVDDLIFLAVLTACSHAGMVTEGIHIFKQMTSYHGLTPKIEHCSCLVDLLGRSGQIEQAIEVLDSMLDKAHPSLWGSLLLACRIHKKVDIAEVVLSRLVELKTDDCGVYVLLSNIYADAGMWGKVREIRKVMNDRNVQKEFGRSMIEVEGTIVTFVSGEKFHAQIEDLHLVIYSLLNMHVLATEYEA